MARGVNSRRQATAAVQNTSNSIEPLGGREAVMEKNASAYAKKWDDLADLKTTGQPVGWGNGEVGNGIIKDGKLHLRDEDIKDIVETNIPVEVKDLLEGEGIESLEDFIPITGKSTLDTGNNRPARIYFNSHAVSVEGTDAFEVTDYDEGSRGDQYEPPSPASASYRTGSAEVNYRMLQVDYEKASGGKYQLDDDSAKRLAKRMQGRFEYLLEDMADNAASDRDWGRYGRSQAAEKRNRDAEDRRKEI